MPDKYIFAKNIRPALESGELNIELPPGAKLSPAAADLIRDYGARVVFSDPADKAGEAPAAGPKEVQAAPADEGPEAGSGVAALRETVREELSETVSEEDVEKILERVMARLSQAKGRTLEPASEAEDDDLIICRCEEITKGQIRAAIAAGMCTLNGVKRVTRAGMGLCQGQTCQLLVTRILCQELGLTPDMVEPTTARPPTRPIPLDLLATG